MSKRPKKTTSGRVRAKQAAMTTLDNDYGLTEDTYAKRDVVVVLDNMRAVMQKAWVKDFQENTGPLIALILEIESLIKDVDHLAAMFRGDDLKTRLTEKVAGRLGDLVIQGEILGDKIGRPFPGRLRQRLIARIQGIAAIQSDNDDGEMLRGVAEDIDQTAIALADWRNSLNFGGRSKGVTPQKQWLREQWSLLKVTSEMTPGEIRLAILDQHAPMNGDKVRQPLSTLEKHQEKAIRQLLNNKRAQVNTGKYEHDLLNK